VSGRSRVVLPNFSLPRDASVSLANEMADGDGRGLDFRVQGGSKDSGESLSSPSWVICAEFSLDWTTSEPFASSQGSCPRSERRDVRPARLRSGLARDS
jgi:hypothetical protein